MSQRKYTDEQLREAVSGSISIAGAMSKLGLKPGGGYETIHRWISLLGIDTSHFKGQGWNRGGTQDWRVRPVSEYLVTGRGTNTSRLRLKLIDTKTLPYRCSMCGGESWLGRPIPIELDHIDGDKTNNSLSNLRLLCPNCHALTPTYKSKNRRD